MTIGDSPHPGRRQIGVRRARMLGLLAIAVVVLMQAVNSFGCYKHDFPTYLGALGFIAVPMLPALVGLFTANPLRAVGASAFFAPWLVVAFYVDCIKPYEGGGASMVYVVVVMYGFATALVGALLSGFILRRLGITVRHEA